MKKWFTKALAFVLAVALAWVPVGDMGSVQAAEGDEVTIPDAAFKAFLLETVGKADGDVLTEGDLAGLGSLRIDAEDGISNLTGLEYCVNLTSLTVYYLSGVDLSPISRLTKLETLNLHYLDITSLPDCSAMTNLKYVDSCYNESLTDISGLANCTTLIDVDLEGCGSLKDISPLKNKLSLTALDLEKVVIDESNKTSYMETISSLTNLTSAYFNYCDLTDEHVSMFAPLTNLKYLELGYCDISNVSWLLSHKDKMEQLTLHGNGNGLVDSATLGQLTNLVILGVSGTGITDFSFVSQLPGLTNLSARWANQWAPATTHTYVFRAIDNGGTISIPNFIKNDKGNLVTPNASEYYTYNAATNEIVVPSTSIHSTWGDLQQNPVFEFEMTSNTGDTLQVKTTMHVNLLMITSEFEDVELDVGENRTFTASTSANLRGDTPTKTYRWYKDGVLIPGANEYKLQLTNAQLSDAGEYTAEVLWIFEDGSHETVSTSKSFTVSVTNPIVPLEITTQPQDTAIIEGRSGSLTVAAQGEGELTYQWYKGDDAISGATSATYNITNMSSDKAGTYKVVVGDSTGATVTSDAISVTMQKELKITKQPTGFTLIEGESGNLSVTAVGEGTLSYQWYKDGAAISGATSSALAFSELEIADAGSYTVKITDKAGSTLTSNAATVTVHNILEITKQPEGIAMVEGNAASLTVVAEGQGTLSYQWYKDDVALSGATSATLSFSRLAMSNAGKYKVVVSDINGTLTSSTVEVAVYNKLEITKQPAGFTVVEGNAKSLTVEAEGEGTLSYQWYKDDVVMTGANGASITFDSIAISDAGEYKVVITDDIGSITSNTVTVEVHKELAILTQPTGFTKARDEAGALAVVAEGEGTLSYQWYKDSAKLEGETGATLSFDSLATTDSGVYTVEVSDVNGTVTSTPVTVVVYTELAILTQPVGFTAIEGNTGSLTVEAEGEGTLKYQWYKDDVALNGETNATLNFDSIAKTDAGTYKVTVTDLNGSVTSTAVTVTVQTALKITTQPAGFSLLVGESGTLTVTAEGEGTLSYQWYKGDAEIAGATFSSLELNNVAEADEAVYKVKVTDQNGSIVSNGANVVVDNQLKITKQPEAVDVMVGSTTNLTVEAEGEGTLTYQWYKGDIAIEGATNTTLDWESISLSDAGTYKVVVSDSNGSITSNEVVVAVDKRLAITGQPTGVTLVEGNTASLSVVAEGAGTLTYQWYKGEEAVAGANKAVFVLNAVTMADAGTYKVKVSDDNGSVVSTAVTVVVQNALEITKQPTGITLIEGNSGSLIVEAEGEGELSYQWYKDGVALGTVAAYALNGAGSATLELNNVTLDDAGTYKVVITDSNGSITSSEAVVVVEQKLVITKQQISITLIEGQNGSLAVEAVGAGEFTYQWYKNDVMIEGANSAEYALNNVQLADAGLYKVVITDKNGTISSDVITVTVQNALRIVMQPEGLTLKAGESGTIQILATGEGTLTYQWFKNGAAIAGATNSSLNLANLSTSDAGEYKVVVSDVNSSLLSNAVAVIVETVVVNEEPASTPAPAPASVPAPAAIAPKTGETTTSVAVMLLAALTLVGATLIRKKMKQM